MDSLLKVEDAAKLLGVSISWLYKASAAGVIPTLKVGRLLRFSPADLQRWLATQRSGELAPIRG